MSSLRLSPAEVLGHSAYLAQAGSTTSKGAPSAPDGGGRAAGPSFGFENLLFPLAIVFVVVFLMIMPQRKKEKRRRQMLGDLARGDRVVTIGGVHGEVTHITDDTLILLVDPQKGTTLKMARSAISRVVTDSQDPEEEKKS